MKITLGTLSQLQPKKVFEYFEALCKIPHGSYNCKAVSDFCVQFAKDRGLEWIQDEAYNVIIKKSASSDYKGDATLILQGHLDMVCQKTEISTIDFAKDSLDLRVDGDFVYAKDTSLGGDDGIAVAYALAILDDDTLKHPNLEVLFTTEEEVGMLGATKLDATPLCGTYLLNIDSEEEGSILSSCAGGSIAKVNIPVEYEEASGTSYEIRIQGLSGGHSGTEIHKNHGNSHKLLGEVLSILEEYEPKVCFLGGSDEQKDNAIPVLSQVMFLANHMTGIQEQLSQLEAKWKKEYGASDPKITLDITKKEQKTTKCLTKDSYDRIKEFLLHVINGVYTMSKDIDGLVESSLNLGVIKLDDTQFVATFGVRSSVEALKDILFEEIDKVAKRCQGIVSRMSDYPSWEYREDSFLREHFCNVYRDLYGRELKVEAIHAGLECGILASKIKNLDMVSFGPDIFDIHTTKERLSISSTKRVWELLLKIIEEFP